MLSVSTKAHSAAAVMMLCTAVCPGPAVAARDTSNHTVVNPVSACSSLKSTLQLDNTIINSATLDKGGKSSFLFPDAGPEPENCVVQGTIGAYTGVINPVTGSDAYGVDFELRMPSDWNRRFFYQGGGGADGMVLPAYGLITSQSGTLPGLMGFAASPQTPALWRGFAVATTDAGHKSLPISSAFGVDPNARVNYGYAAIGALTPVAKQIIGAYFGLQPKRSYFVGCSKGGQEAMQASQKYGNQFDGIVAGDPGFHLPHAAIAEAWNTQQLAAVAKANAPWAVDSAGNPLLYKAFTPSDLDLIRQGVLAACDGLDGIMDGMIFNTQACIGRFDPTSMQCPAGNKKTCLSALQVTALKAIMGGAKDSSGQPLYASFPYDTDLGSIGGWPLWNLGLPLGGNLSFNTTLGASSSRYVFTTPPNADLSLFNVDMDAYDSSIHATSGVYTPAAVDFMDADSTNLDALNSHGGKLLLYHGASDPVFSVSDTIEYYNKLSTAYGSATPTFVRLFVVPGMNHCVGGDYTTDSFDSLDAIVTWVESGVPPTRLLAQPGDSKTTQLPSGTVRPLCAYPSYARYKGWGESLDATHFSCATP